MKKTAMLRKFNKSAVMLLVALLLLNVGSVQAMYLDDYESIMLPSFYSYDHLDIRSSLWNGYETDADTQLYHVVANKNFAVEFGSETIKIGKGDVLLMFDVPALQKSNRAAIVDEEGMLFEVNRDNLKKEKDGNLYKSKAIDVEKNMLTAIMFQFAPDKSGIGKYIYEEPDLKSERLGVFRRGTVLASGRELVETAKYGPFYSVSLPGDKTGYLFLGQAKADGFPQGGISHFVNEF